MLVRVLFFSIAAAFLIAVLLAPLFIPILRRLKFGQTIREEGPKGHQKKAGTPTMGGIIILLALTFTVIKFANQSVEIFLLLFITLGYGLIGFLDDFIKIVMKRNLGLTARQKLFGQLVIGGVFYYVLLRNGYDTIVSIPGTDWGIELGWLYLPLVLLMTIGASNAVNLTDGLDGLLAGTSAIAFSAYAVIAWTASQMNIAIFSAAVVGAVLGFLVFNAHPAKVFMGDTGSLALGGALAGVAILTKTEILLVIIGGVFVMEALSVIIQVISFKTRKKRVFRMSPLHHHYELGGWSEWRVVVTFWFAGLICASLGVYIGVLS
ncbi:MULTISPECIES: phospho-N-acetylmuramoyl-pentapeptide-transferase [Aneurinibacillus]|uniref:Phospho-N-acetylmuramoyl-pentapeptide-transferase n=1 Tax=Aneurinibacillus thermoaerophilus TaxID=143495 RepID=A0A1G7W8A7_ANETH|nr:MULTISPECIES: phospho-N-acetylmuramoyl-pentapeptide-transferase [Aneurinibacillus]AMA72569.1 phospho-N-acetylmuramoyl-pentapeptide-transferase [Aneurinibacillus sp. XH2]MED0674725.1 phospho-N-acetylmuramoyl-pentapeptide-transferase [Aneurinibacillus thermoaerophilus]MED0736843.1 phospho-N-acetylmuramoyl-pentapeptide-transferase [Aneurinibacillus thermoaerophilus]MED0756684.1 phospho-N-acetylmuramoyl-pentapeptide-transferase [Aneurinibacillus thermoaerophilus]MED0760734.1 phospho-N-acetylmur